MAYAKHMGLLAKILPLVLLALFVHFAWGWGNSFEWLKEFIRMHENPGIFFAVMGFGCALFFPLSWCYLYAGGAFGLFQAWALCMAGLFVSGSIGFLLGKFFTSKNLLLKLERRFKVPVLCERKIYHINFFIRAVPGVPYGAQNIILGGIGTNFSTYTFVNMTVQGMMALAMNLLGSSLFRDGGPVKVGVFVCLALALFLAHRVLRKFCVKNPASETGTG